jgi:hypothetical protein
MNRNVQPGLAALAWGMLAAALLVTPSAAQDHGARNRFPPKLGFDEPQFELESNGTLLMLWAHPTEKGHDLYVVHRLQGTAFSDPVLVNDAAGAVVIGNSDEMRPSIASGPDGAVAVAWTDRRGGVMAAFGHDHGAKFDAPIQLNQKAAAISPSYVVITFDDRGQLHATWIDSRDATPGETGPAHLYYATVVRGRVTEENLTKDFTESICANSRPAIYVQRRGEIEFTYRNMDEDGGRDITRITREANGKLDEPVRLGPPMATGSCPPAGSIQRADVTAWRDTSQDEPRLVVFRSNGAATSVIVAGDDQWSFTRSPRFVESSENKDIAIFAPGSPRGRIYLLQGGSWKLVASDIPEWCTDVAWIEGQILMVGDVHGEFRLEAKVIRW